MTAPSTSWFTLGDAVREHAITCGSAPAIVCGEVRLTWSELDRRVDRAAAALAAAEVEAGDRVLWLGQNCHRLLELLLAAGRLGAALCPANWRLSAEELAFVVDDLEPRVVVWQEAEIGERVRAARAVARAAGGATWVRHDARGPDTYEASLDGAGDPRTPPGASPSTPSAPCSSSTPRPSTDGRTALSSPTAR